MGGYGDVVITADTSKQHIQKITKAPSDGQLDIGVTDRRSEDFTEVNVTDIMVFDLTQMFGTTIADYIYSLEQGNAGAGVAWFKNLFPKDYYAYNAGEVTNVSAVNGDEYEEITADLGRTVYGGTVDVVTGVLTVTWASDTKQWNEYIAEHAPTGNIFKRRTFQISNNAVSGSDHSITNCIATYNVGTPTTIPFYYVFDNYFYAWLPVDTADDFSLQLVYELATPTTYQLTPTQIHALLGQNNIWADCGDVEVQYKADVQRWVEKMLNA